MNNKKWIFSALALGFSLGIGTIVFASEKSGLKTIVKDFYSVRPSAKSETAVVGKNTFDFTVKNRKGKTVKGLKITATVFMTSMDMGTTNPTVDEKGKGLYSLDAEFSMEGPWRVKLDITLPDGKVETHAVDFEVKNQ